MGRPESQLSGTDPELVKFADDLRRLRQQAGSPSYRRMAAQAHYSASALSQAANGRSLPSLTVTLGFVRACDGDADEWERRWQELSGATAEEAEAAEPAPVPVPGRRFSRPPWATAAGVVAAGIAIYLAVPAGSSGKSPAAAPSVVGRADSVAGRADPVADGSDPNRAGCGPGAVTLESTRVHFPTDQLSGLVELRYSPQCHTAWSRFSPDGKWRPGPNTMVTVLTIRPADQATQSYTVEFGGEAIIGNMLTTAHGCVAAEVTMARGETTSPVATTPCQVID